MHITFQVSDLKVFNILFNFSVSSRRPSPYNPSFALFLTLGHTTEHYVFLYNIYFNNDRMTYFYVLNNLKKFILNIKLILLIIPAGLIFDLIINFY